MNRQKMEEMINDAKQFLTENQVNIEDISLDELIAYFEGEAPSGDTTTLEDVFKNKWLLIHELVELSELKKKGLKISSKLLFTHQEEVEKTHIIASNVELLLANKYGDKEWVAKRCKGVKMWLEEIQGDKQYGFKKEVEELFEKRCVKNISEETKN